MSNRFLSYQTNKHIIHLTMLVLYLCFIVIFTMTRFVQYSKVWYKLVTLYVSPLTLYLIRPGTYIYTNIYILVYKSLVRQALPSQSGIYLPCSVVAGSSGG